MTKKIWLRHMAVVVLTVLLCFAMVFGASCTKQDNNSSDSTNTKDTTDTTTTKTYAVIFELKAKDIDGATVTIESGETNTSVEFGKSLGDKMPTVKNADVSDTYAFDTWVIYLKDGTTATLTAEFVFDSVFFNNYDKETITVYPTFTRQWIGPY